jgi:flagellar biosynthesis anti-sigma factor FlgM
MRIDVNTAALAQLAADHDSKQVRNNASGSGTLPAAASSQSVPAVPSEDTATLSSNALSRSSLASRALQSPAIRQDKVDVLAQALHSGQYELNPGSIANAIVADRAR